MNAVVDVLMKFFGGFIIFYMSVVTVAYTCMLIFAFIEIRKQYKLDKTALDEDYIDALYYYKPLSITSIPVGEANALYSAINRLFSSFSNLL
jgi:biofilm PGA synthesis N-glycosyltransferase PgaC